MRRRGRFFAARPGAFALVAMLVGTAAAVVLSESQRASFAACHARTEGVVVASGVREEVRRRDRGGDPRTVWWPEVTVEFVVDGRRERTSRWAIVTAGSDDRDAIVAAVSPFAVGRTVPVWYDPGDPRRAVLHRAFSAVTLLPALVGTLCALIDVLIARLAKDQRRRRRAGLCAWTALIGSAVHLLYALTLPVVTPIWFALLVIACALGAAAVRVARPSAEDSPPAASDAPPVLPDR